MDFDQTMLDTLHGRLPQGVAVFDADLRLVYANARWSSFLDQAAGSGRACGPGTRVADLFPGAEDLRVAAQCCVRTCETVQLPGRSFVTGDGEGFWDVTLAPTIADGLATGFVCVVEDATARVQAERAAAATARLAAFRADVSQALPGSDDVDVVLQSCTEAMVRHASAAFARIWVLDEAEDVFRLRASAGLYTRLNGTYARIPVEWVRREMFPVNAPIVATDIPRTHRVRDPEWAAVQGLVAWANHPLSVRGRVIGFMAMFARRNFDPDILGELAAVADAIAQFLERKHAEASLREREVLFRDVFESAADGLVIYDLETGQVLEANPAICRMHGYAHDEFAGLNRIDLVNSDSHSRLRNYLEDIRAGGSARVQLAHVRKDGTLFHAAVQGSQILYRGHPAVLGVVRDVTKEYEAQERLERRVAERTHELRMLLDLSRSISLMSELDPLIEVIFDRLRQLVDYESVAIGLADGDEYTTVAVRRDEHGRRSRDPLGTRYVIDRSQFLWRELTVGTTLYSPDVDGDDDVARGFRQLVGDRLGTTYGHVRSLLAAPLIVANELIGVMFISSAKVDYYRRHDRDLVAAIANQIAVAIANARLHQQARTVAALEERQRLARELHDSVSQALFGIGLGAQTARTMLDRDPAQAAAPMDYVVQLAAAGMAEMRALIFELRPESLRQEGLVAALEKQAAATRARHAIAVELALGDEPDLPLEAKEALYRIAQEAMHNTAKHACASEITLRLATTADLLTKDVTDNGGGFDSSAPYPGHLGLVSMRERVARLGGRVEIESAPGQGTRVHVRLPLRPSR